ncbi:hypothetical protein B0H17DRAFT_1324514 [Mycena rosella]|uniref:Uncharacterized protein n=1 Tax=Mycena rosella TaxID=1033263 RepID=A0AAD7MBM1_MYCRO|nr:hypothetical protein B0H17DRAFT_1324514 [Mycena rosella]
MPEVGAIITVTKIREVYQLAGSDLAPLSYTEKPNLYGGPYQMTLYYLADVKALAARIPGAPAATASGSSRFAAPTGDRIVRTQAMKTYNLKDVQMDRLKPVIEEPNPRGGTRPVRFYNVCDMMTLATAQQALG